MSVCQLRRHKLRGAAQACYLHTLNLVSSRFSRRRLGRAVTGDAMAGAGLWMYATVAADGKTPASTSHHHHHQPSVARYSAENVVMGWPMAAVPSNHKLRGTTSYPRTMPACLHDSRLTTPRAHQARYETQASDPAMSGASWLPCPAHHTIKPSKRRAKLALLEATPHVGCVSTW